MVGFQVLRVKSLFKSVSGWEQYASVWNPAKEMANRPTQQELEALVVSRAKSRSCSRPAEDPAGKTGNSEEVARVFHYCQRFGRGGVLNDGPAWAKYWAEKKCALKRLCQQRAQSMRRTGGGIDRLPELSQLEQRLVAVMGGDSFATGDAGIAVDPFPHSSSQQNELLEFVLAPEIEEQVPILPEAPVESAAGSQSAEATAGPSHSAGPSHAVEPSHSAGPSQQQQQEASRLQSATRRGRLGGQRSRQRRLSFAEDMLQRFEAIETRRVEAETRHAEALAQSAAAQAQSGAAQAQSAAAQTQYAAAHTQLAAAVAEFVGLYSAHIDRRSTS